MNSHSNTNIAEQNSNVVEPSAASLNSTQAAPSTYTTTDASGYPDRRDGISAHGTTDNNVIQDPHEQHKYNQVQDGSRAHESHIHAQAHHPIGGHSATGHLHGSETLVGQPIVEVAEQVRDPSLPMNTIVPNFIK